MLMARGGFDLEAWFCANTKAFGRGFGLVWFGVNICLGWVFLSSLC